LHAVNDKKPTADTFFDTVRTRNDFYLGWYNLAFAYDDKKDFANGKKAYERAVELEPKQPARDASLYNSYGFFLYTYRKYQEAIPQPEKSSRNRSQPSEGCEHVTGCPKARSAMSDMFLESCCREWPISPP